MAAWEGFTEDELQRMQSPNQTNSSSKLKPKIVKPVSRKNPNHGPAQRSNAGKRQIKKTGNPVEAVNASNEIPNAALLSRSPPPPARSKSEGDGIHSKSESAEAKDEKLDCIFDEESIQKIEKLKLEDVQLRQKQMQEKNRRKKDMLTKEISERKKKALAESSKLVKIQQELVKLDQLLNVDVSLLRDKIDEACMEFSLAQKRFDKAETEYIAAKMDLHRKTVMKEDLTEHLFNLIQANEERKAKKLEELMHKLDVEEEELEVKEMQRRESEKNETKRNENEDLETTIVSSEKSPLPNIEKKIDSPSDSANGESLHGANSTKDET